ncbi:hypothetical protein FRD01_06390 [Microvenator marinus]|jgi:hypothetical protein|uniref:Stringent starvation protein B n=1 Tax=Microvenator marinus TaxID=2600177 RepID=A0A5B8XMX0_9DELT|nr:ClpXP protease specificity-enhancing factor SspB [Microvenator marinus]QED26875.1 hypothetical protein FRD01_06390 [Microvenator marinus]
MSDNPEGKVIHVAFGAARNPEPEVQEPVSEEAKHKLEVFSELIESGIVMVTLDTRVEGVHVPQQFAGMPQLHLNFSYDYQIPDFDFDGEGVRASLSFSGVNTFCEIPWDAVYMMRPETIEDSVVFPMSFPQEILDMLPPEILEELQAAQAEEE